MKTFALSIGPIVDTIASARKTREVWAASYVFSYLIKSICKAIPEEERLSPTLLNDANVPKGAGIYPDIVIWKSKKDLASQSTLVRKVVEDVCKLLEASPTEDGEEGTSTIERENTFKLAPLLRLPLFELPAIEGQNVFLAASQLASQEETWTPLPAAGANWFDEKRVAQGSALDQKDRLSAQSWANALVKRVWGKKALRLRSLLEVSAVELAKGYGPEQCIVVPITRKKDLPPKNERNLWERVQEASTEESLHTVLAEAYPDQWRMRHKYMAVIHGDGDKIGAEIISVYGKTVEDVRAISKKLAEYACWASGVIADYGGQPIYAGGDDLFFFAPLAGSVKCEHNYNTLPKLLRHLSDAFTNQMSALLAELKGVKEVKSTASVSFGVHIMHYKQPLDQAIQSAQYLLFGVAKEQDVRPAAALRLEMHSNAPSAEAIFVIASPSWSNLENLVAGALELDRKGKVKVGEQSASGFFSTLQHKQAEYLDELSLMHMLDLSAKPFYARLVRQGGEDEPITKEMQLLTSTSLVGVRKLALEDDKALVTLKDLKALEIQEANLQFALKLSHLYQRKDTRDA